MSRNTLIEGMNYELPHPFRVESEKVAKQFGIHTYKDNGVIRWRTNGHVPNIEILEFWRFYGKRFNMVKSVAALKKENKAFLDKYKKERKNWKPSREELTSMR